MLIGKAITLVESTNFADTPHAAVLLDGCLTHTKGHQSKRIGITGVPGVGKSTFINILALQYAQQNKKTAILTIDPTSKQTLGSILGDKTRMHDIISNPNVFIRPSAAGSTLGGISATTEQVITIFEAAGYENIIVETVGVGQSETEVSDLTDIFILLMLPTAGDELQGIKRGIMEVADIVFVNKTDIDAQQAKVAIANYKSALHLFPPSAKGWTPTVLSGTALQGTSIIPVIDEIDKYFSRMRANGYLLKNRHEQNKRQLIKQLEMLIWKKYQHQSHQSFATILEDVRDNKLSTLSAALLLAKL